jgi:hypothetical protein
MIIDFTTISQGDISGYTSDDCKMVIVNSAQWVDFWKIHDGRIIFEDESINQVMDRMPEIDFNYHSVIAVIIGKGSTNYLTEILSVETSSDQAEDSSSLLITFRCQIPMSVSLVGCMCSEPYHLIKIPKIDADKVIFKEK